MRRSRLAFVCAWFATCTLFAAAPATDGDPHAPDWQEDDFFPSFRDPAKKPLGLFRAQEG